MLIIKMIPDPEMQQYLCTLCDAEYDEEYDAFSCYENEKFVGICQFICKDDTAYIKDLKCRKGISDSEALIIMGRGVLNYVDLHGTHKAKCAPDASSETIILACGFKRTDNGFFVDLEGFFDGKCEGHCLP